LAVLATLGGSFIWCCHACASHPAILALVSYLEHDVLPSIILDTDYNILAANAAYRRQFGSDDHAPVGEKCHRVSHHYAVPCDQAGEHCPMRKSLDSKVPSVCCTSTTRLAARSMWMWNCGRSSTSRAGWWPSSSA
jgi:PAS domain-containing protein